MEKNEIIFWGFTIVSWYLLSKKYRYNDWFDIFEGVLGISIGFRLVYWNFFYYLFKMMLS